MKKIALTTSFLALAVPAAAFVAPTRDSRHAKTKKTTTTTCQSAAATVLVEPVGKLLVATGAAVGASLGTVFLRNHGTKAMLDRIDEVFPGSLTHAELVQRVSEKLDQALNSTNKDNILLCTSLCRDEISRQLERDFGAVYGGKAHYAMGGLAGFPFGGVTAFASMASHIPTSGGAALVVFGPHVGVDDGGHLGTVNRRGRDSGGSGPCCEAAVAASKYVTSVGAKMFPPNKTGQDVEQTLLCNALLPYAERLEQSAEPMADLPYSLYDAQKEMIAEIVQKSCTAIPAKSKVAILGGIEINTPPGTTDYFIPLSFDLYDNTGSKVADLTL